MTIYTQGTILYLETYEARVNCFYRTLRHKSIAVAHFWKFVADKYPDVNHCSATLPRHVRDYIPHAVARARTVQRGPRAGEEVRPTAYAWMVELRTFFSDLCAWATEPGSPFAPFAPRTIPITRHTLLGCRFEKTWRVRCSNCLFRAACRCCCCGAVWTRRFAASR